MKSEKAGSVQKKTSATFRKSGERLLKTTLKDTVSAPPQPTGRGIFRWHKSIQNQMAQ